VIEWVPAERFEMGMLATPPFKSPVPIKELSLRNCTVPVGVPDPGLSTVTVAVNVTASPSLAEGLLEVRLVVVLAALTVWPPLRDPELP
jgi:hypothetical protein